MATPTATSAPWDPDPPRVRDRLNRHVDQSDNWAVRRSANTSPMATRETRLNRGRRRGESLTRRLVNELVVARQSRNISQRRLAAELHRSQSELWRLEHVEPLRRISLVDLAEVASALGLELAASLYPVGDPIRDKGHIALLGRFRALLSPAYRVTAETPLPLPGDRRSWDLLLRLDGTLIGVECETRVRDGQALVRHIRERERDGGVDHVVLILAESAANRRLLPQLREMLGDRFATPARVALACLRSGTPLPGSAVLLV